MQFNIEKTISNFIESQFPQFYLDDGPNFVLFVKCYYEWLESQGQAIAQSRNLLEYRDIDSTLVEFLEHFQQKYLYGIPFDVIINKRYLLKHILDVYRSKGSINCYKLLFKLIYNQDVEIYLPGQDILKPSDGTWVQPRYIEVTNTGNLQNYVGQTIVGASSGTTATVESYISEPVNNNIINILYLSNIAPSGGQFAQGEKVILYENNSVSIDQSPSVIGSLQALEIINGAQGFRVGDIIEIAHTDPNNGNNIISTGVGGKLKVLSTNVATGAVSFFVVDSGAGYNMVSNVFIYNANGDITGNGASFSIGPLADTSSVTYNTDLIINYTNTVLNSAGFAFPANVAANINSAINTAFSYTTDTFGSVSNLIDVKTGNNYIFAPVVFVRAPVHSLPLTGNVSYTTTSNTITGNGTTFSTIFNANDTIYIQANTLVANSAEYKVIQTVVDNTHIVLYGPPTYNSTPSATYAVAPEIFPASFALYEPIMYRNDNTISGNNLIIAAVLSSGNGVVASAVAIDSGKGYVDNELVNAYSFAYNGLNPPTVLVGGNNYTNGDSLVFSGGSYTTSAQGYIVTNPSGNVVGTVLTYTGSNYLVIPAVTIKSNTGVGANLSVSIGGVGVVNSFATVQGRVVKGGVGVRPGYWSTTRGFLNSDKYIQDSYFYQDFSYQIKVANILSVYKDILYQTFHVAGSELFGKYLLINNESSPVNLLYDSTTATIS